MDSKIVALVILLSFTFMIMPAEMGQHGMFNPVVSAEIIDGRNTEVNFDELEDIALGCNAFEKAEFSKPSKILILLRIVGMPIFNAYLKMTDGMAKFSAWVNSIFKKNARHEARQ